MWTTMRQSFPIEILDFMHADCTRDRKLDSIHFLVFSLVSCVLECVREGGSEKASIGGIG